MPDWYPLIRASRELHQAPWVMAGIPETVNCAVWVLWTLDSVAAEKHAEGVRMKSKFGRG